MYRIAKNNISIEMTARQIWEEFGVDIDNPMTITEICRVFSLYSIQTGTTMTEYGFADTVYVIDRWSNRTVRIYKFDDCFEITLGTINNTEFSNALYKGGEIK